MIGPGLHSDNCCETLATMIEKEWSLNGTRDAYTNARSSYYRTAMLNRLIHAPERLDFWLQSEWVKYSL
jgi:hypothetical protein